MVCKTITCYMWRQITCVFCLRLFPCVTTSHMSVLFAFVSMCHNVTHACFVCVCFHVSQRHTCVFCLRLFPCVTTSHMRVLFAFVSMCHNVSTKGRYIGGLGSLVYICGLCLPGSGSSTPTGAASSVLTADDSVLVDDSVLAAGDSVLEAVLSAVNCDFGGIFKAWFE